MVHIRGMTPLAQYLTSSGRTQKSLAAALKLNQATVSKFARGRARPSITTAINIERETGGAVPVSAWGDAAPLPAVGSFDRAAE